MQMIEVRLINEVYCARLAAARADDTHINDLVGIIDRASKAISARDVHAMMTLDREFHLVVANATKNFELVEVVRKLNERSLRFWFISFTTSDHHHSFQEQHEAIFAAIRDHDADGAESAMRAHIEAFRHNVARHL
jgi:DNA-binding GntR family transcriptional regulator